MSIKYYDYDKDKYQFVNFFQRLFECEDLSKIHKKSLEYSFFQSPGNDSDTNLHKIFYDYMRSTPDEMLSMYKKFIKNEIAPKIQAEDKIIYQKWPTFRVHLPDNVAVGGWHTDGDYNHPKGEINFIVAITEMFESNTTIVESQPGKKDFRQLELSPGMYARFNGNECTHGNLPNRTGVSRVSFDFRVMKFEDYDPDHQLMSLSKGNKFIIGDYYEVMEL